MLVEDVFLSDMGAVGSIVDVWVRQSLFFNI